MINDRIDFVRSLPVPENIYYFFLHTNVDDIPQKWLNYFFDLTTASISFFQVFKNHDHTSKKAEEKLKAVLMELYLRMEKEHIPEVAEPVEFRFHEKPEWEGLDGIWKIF